MPEETTTSPSIPQPPSTNLTTTSKNTTATLTYALGYITGIFFLITEKQDKNIRFHAMQSTITFGALGILGYLGTSILGIVGGLILGSSGGLAIAQMFSSLISLVSFGLWILLIFKTSRGEKFLVPFVGDFTEKKIYTTEPSTRDGLEPAPPTPPTTS